MVDSVLAKKFVEFSVSTGALRFGEFKTKSGRDSPYFFNAGTLNSGNRLWDLAGFYCQAIMAANIDFDMLYGPAYKGIPLAVSTAVRYAASHHKDYSYAFNRKESKDHGEKGMLVGAPLTGKVLIIDDVITAGISVRESVDIIRDQGATPCGIVIALDRMEKGEHSERSAVQEVVEKYQIPVISVATISDVIAYLKDSEEFASYQGQVENYRNKYGV